MPVLTESTEAIELREKAGAAFREAKAYRDEHVTKDADGVETLSAEDEATFDRMLAAAQEMDSAYLGATKSSGQQMALRERLDFYAGKAGSSPIPWGATSVIPGVFGDTDPHLSLGEKYVRSDAYIELRKSGQLNGDSSSAPTVHGKRFSSSAGEYEPDNVDALAEYKAPTDVIGTGAGPGGALVLPDYQPGILPLPQRPLTIRDVLSQARTTSDLISYARQSAFDDAAAPVAQATAAGGSGAKPQSSIAWTRATTPIETIATWMAATKRQLADAGQTAGLIDNQLRLMLNLEIEDQLIAGNGTSPNLRGLRNTVGIQTLDVSAVAGNADVVNFDGLRSSIRLIRVGAARAVPDAMVVNPLDSEELDLTRNSQADYRGGGPFAQDATGQPRPIWGLRRIESEAIPAGKVLVGAYRVGATVFEREGIAITSSDSHADFFTRNLVAILGETRLGLAVFFPAAFVEVTLKTW